MVQDLDYIVIGGGFAGAILAERLSTQLNKKILVIEKRNHIAGNMYDYNDKNDILVHKYGPHIFRTNDKKVVEYLSQFTGWHEYNHRVVAYVDNKLLPVPFNLKSLEILFPEEKAKLYKDELLNFFGSEVKVPISKLRAHKNKDIRELGELIFKKIYLNYTVKQWGDLPENLDFETITARVPVHISYDDRYFQHHFQSLPDQGYTKMFNKMLSSPNIKIQLNTNSSDVIELDQVNLKIYFKGKEFKGNLIYTGPLDELFRYKFGELPYRSLRFVTESHNIPIFQPTATVNYPNTQDYTRITEYNHMMKTPNKTKTTIMYEFPQEYDKDNPIKDIPYYPIPKDSNAKLYQKYQDLANAFINLRLIGRLAEYKYYDMNDIVLKALNTFDSIQKQCLSNNTENE